MYTHTCGDLNKHWYGKGPYCDCGQVPNHLLSTPLCDCGGGRLDPPEHITECRVVGWAEERNGWIAGHPDLSPPLQPVRRVVRSPESGNVPGS